MSQHDTCDGDAEYARVGEVGEAKPAGLVLLTEDHILLGADQRSPRAHAPFQRAPNAGADLRMAPPDLVKHRNGPYAGSRLQDRHNLAVPNLGQWVRTPAASRRFLLRRQPRIILDAVAGCPAEAGLGGSNGGIFAMSVNHVQPHLVVGDVKAGQYLIPQFRDESDTWPGRSRPPDRTNPTGKSAPPRLADLRSGYALAPSVQLRRI